MFDIEIERKQGRDFKTSGVYVYVWQCPMCAGRMLPNLELFFVVTHARMHTKEFHGVQQSYMRVVVKEVLGPFDGMELAVTRELDDVLRSTH